MTEEPFIHKYAYKNFITNFIFHREIAKKLPKLFKKKVIVNVGGKIQSVYQFAKKYNPKIKSKILKKTKKFYQFNTSMNIKKFNKISND